jgi:hypothetical protein
LASLAYSVATAPQEGIDLRIFQRAAQNWLAGSFVFESGPGHLYPPFALPMLAPLALFSIENLLIAFLLINLAATAATLYLCVKLYGEDWPPGIWIYLSAFLIAWAPFRVTVRNGQISLIITALVLGALLARRRKKHLLSGLLLGLSLFKYSLTLPFFLYILWKREWKIAVSALILPAVLTQVSAWHLGISAIEAVGRSLRAVGELQTANHLDYTGTTEIKLFIFSLTGGNRSLTSLLTLALAVAALAWLAALFSRRPGCENAHFAALALFALWVAYHRTYDSVLCIMPAALLVDSYLKGRFTGFSKFWLAGLGLFILSIPGLLTERLNVSQAFLLHNPVGWLGLHIERLMVFGFFWFLTLLLWRLRPSSNAAG